MTVRSEFLPYNTLALILVQFIITELVHVYVPVCAAIQVCMCTCVWTFMSVHVNMYVHVYDCV